jgi:DNA-binding transcriptional MerR regulator
MIPIGPFSELTGLSIKTLRHYHEQGLLIPERIDEHSQERAYSVWQLMRAAQISALRRAGVPIARARQLLDEPEGAAMALDAFEADARARRLREDDALAEARATLAAVPAVTVRHAPDTTVITIDLDARLGVVAETTLEAAAVELNTGAAAAGASPAEAWWTSLEGGIRGLVERVAVEIRGGIQAEDLPHSAQLRAQAGGREAAVRLPVSPHLGALSLATAHLLAHEEPGHFADIARMRRVRLAGEVEYVAPLVPIPGPAIE